MLCSINSQLNLYVDTARREPALDPIAVDSDGLLVDIETMNLDPKTSRKDATRDVDEFFGRSYEKEGYGGKVNSHRDCKIWCAMQHAIELSFHRLPLVVSKRTLIADCSTARRHLAYLHKVSGVYCHCSYVTKHYIYRNSTTTGRKRTILSQSLLKMWPNEKKINLLPKKSDSQRSTPI